ncbi:MAG: Long-chain-fatty-acid--CoA ligase [Syntrophus sp. PtaU1.Bin208]|nr:MAG: Long-chain-fatty-acid--CoA ligase [Syntrophus sp. PtaU1.Bin208]
MTTKNSFYEGIFPHCADPSAPYVKSRYSVGDIQGLAFSLKERLQPFAEKKSTVCLWTEDRGLIMAALLASLAGGPVFALPHAFSPQVIHELQEICPVSVILTDRDDVNFAGVERITPPDFRPAAALPTPLLDPQDTCLKLFTGGSTGTPRIWDKTPAGLLGESAFLARQFGICPEDVLLAAAPPQHIYGLLFSVILPFLAGARVLPETFSFPREIIAGISRYCATILIGVPFIYRTLRLDTLERRSLRRAFSSAGKVNPEDAIFFKEKTGLPITEIYGSTETGGIAFQDSPDDRGRLQPFSEVSWEIAGERLCVRSPFLSGNLPRDEEGFFITADRAVSLGPKNFKLLGRADEVVKIAGKRVDLAEVQEKIQQIKGVQEALVLALPEASGRRQEIVALVVGSLDRQMIRQHLGDCLEPYAMPRHILRVAGIPVTPAGKIDRRRIEEMLPSRKSEET